MNENKINFFAENVIFEHPGKKIGKDEIDEIDDFPGKKDFIKFYNAHNGGDFTYGAWFIPEDCYNIFKNGEEPYITLEFFLPIPVDNDCTDDDIIGLNMEVVKDIIVEKYSAFEDFVLFHIPFAMDVTGNPFWIDIQSGEIKYTDFQKSQIPDDAMTVAFSFKDFCNCIRKRSI